MNNHTYFYEIHFYFSLISTCDLDYSYKILIPDSQKFNVLLLDVKNNSFLEMVIFWDILRDKRENIFI